MGLTCLRSFTYFIEFVAKKLVFNQNVSGWGSEPLLEWIPALSSNLSGLRGERITRMESTIGGD